MFAAGLGLRRTELLTVEADPHPDVDSRDGAPHPPAETLVEPNQVTEREIEQPAVAAGVMVAEVFSFGDILERMLEVLLVVLVGVSLASHWDWDGLWLGLLLIVLIRPVATLLLLTGSRTTSVQRWLIGWFGIRGVGSLYYLAYANTHGLNSSDDAGKLAGLTISSVAASIVIHGVTSQPLMQWYERSFGRLKDA